jgi:hypothetical protein
LLDEFRDVTDALATTMEGTILIVYEGSGNADAWLETMSETILNFRNGSRAWQQTSPASGAA